MPFSNLTTRQKRAFWAEVEQALHGLLAGLPESFPDVDRDTVRDYLAHNELGLALEHLCDALIEENLSISGQQYLALSKLFERMELDPSGRLSSLRHAV
jgi:hypothetical protein